MGLRASYSDEVTFVRLLEENVLLFSRDGHRTECLGRPDRRGGEG